MHRQEVRDRPALVRRLVVGDHMDLFAARLIDHNVGQEDEEFGRGVPRRHFTEHLAGLGVEGGIQRQGAVTKVFKTVPFGASRGQRQNRILAIQGLDGGLFIHAEYRCMRWRVGAIRQKGESVMQRPVSLFLETSTSKLTSENSKENVRCEYGSVSRRLMRASVFLATVTFVLTLAITIAHAQTGSTNAPTSILDEYKSLEGQWISLNRSYGDSFCDMICAKVSVSGLYEKLAPYILVPAVVPVSGGKLPVQVGT